MNITGYERTKQDLKAAARLIDEGDYPAADTAIRGSWATPMDLANVLGESRIKKMRQWKGQVKGH